MLRGFISTSRKRSPAFVDRYFLSGDIGYMDEDGFLFIVDRKKDMIVSSGFNVYPASSRRPFTSTPVREAIVIGVPDNYRGEAIKAFVTSEDGAPDFTLGSCTSFCTTRSVAMKCRRSSNSATRCRAPRSASCRRTSGSGGTAEIPHRSRRQRQLAAPQENRHMPEAVIVSTARTPLTKAHRGEFNITHGADARRPCRRACGRARRHRARRGRGRDHRLRLSPKARPAATSRARRRSAPACRSPSPARRSTASAPPACRRSRWPPAASSPTACRSPSPAASRASLVADEPQHRAATGRRLDRRSTSRRSTWR